MFVPAFALPHQCDDGYPLMRMAASYYSALDYVGTIVDVVRAYPS